MYRVIYYKNSTGGREVLATDIDSEAHAAAIIRGHAYNYHNTKARRHPSKRKGKPITFLTQNMTASYEIERVVE